jgi:hypothetical protein
MWNSAFSVLVAIGIMAGALFLGLEKPEWVPGLDAPSDRVLVFIVGTPEGVDRVRKAVAPERVVAATSDAFALAEGRIVAANVEAVAGPYTEAGWTDRELEFFVIEKNDRPVRGRQLAADAMGMDEERLARLQELLHQKTLSYGEQIFVLQAMNDGYVF